MFLLSPSLNPVASWEFEGEILVLHHPTTISTRYQAMVHCGSIRQTAAIMAMSMECLRTGDKATVHFRFIKHPEYINLGQRLVFRESRTKAVGMITKVIPMTLSAPVLGITKTKVIKNAPKQNPRSGQGSGSGGGGSQAAKRPEKRSEDGGHSKAATTSNGEVTASHKRRDRKTSNSTDTTAPTTNPPDSIQGQSSNIVSSK